MSDKRKDKGNKNNKLSPLFLTDENYNNFKLSNHNQPVKFHLTRQIGGDLDSVIGFGYIKNGDLHVPMYPNMSTKRADYMSGQEYFNSVDGRSTSLSDKDKVRYAEGWREYERVFPDVYKKGKPYKIRKNKEMNALVPVYSSDIYDVIGVDYKNGETGKTETRLRDDMLYRLSYFPVDYTPLQIKNPNPKYSPYVYEFGDQSRYFKYYGSTKYNSLLEKKFMNKEELDNELKKAKTIFVRDPGGNVLFSGKYDDYIKFIDKQDKSGRFVSDRSKGVVSSHKDTGIKRYDGIVKDSVTGEVLFEGSYKDAEDYYLSVKSKRRKDYIDWMQKNNKSKDINQKDSKSKSNHYFSSLDYSKVDPSNPNSSLHSLSLGKVPVYDKKSYKEIESVLHQEDGSSLSLDGMYSRYMDVKKDPKNAKFNDYELYNKYGVFNPWDKRFKEQASHLRKE